MKPIRPVTISAIRSARSRIAGTAMRSPLLRLDSGDAPTELWLKLECLQPIGSFKVRGAANAIALADSALLEEGVYTGSAGNMAQGVALAAQRLGVPCRVVVPDTAPQAKLEAIARLGATAVPLPRDEWWSVLCDHGHPREDGYFVHPVSNPAVIAGNGTIGMEIVEELPNVRAVVVSYGGGGLSCGIAAALRSLAPGVPVFAAEVETGAPFAASLQAGTPVEGAAPAVLRRRDRVDRRSGGDVAARTLPPRRIGGGGDRGGLRSDPGAGPARAHRRRGCGGGGGGGGAAGSARDRGRSGRGGRLRREHRPAGLPHHHGGAGSLTPRGQTPRHSSGDAFALDPARAHSQMSR